MTTRRVFVYGGKHNNKDLDDDYDEPSSSTSSSSPPIKSNKTTFIKPKIIHSNNLGAKDSSPSLSSSDYFNSYTNKKRVDLKNDIDFDSSLYKDSINNNSILPKKANTIYVLRDDFNENEYVSPVVNYTRKYEPQEKKAVNLSRTQSLNWIPGQGKPPNEKSYFHEFAKFDKRTQQLRRQMPMIRCEIDEPVLHEKPLPNRSVIHNGTIIYK